MSALLTEAKRLTAAGFSIIPVKRNKRPARVSWTAQQQTIATLEELKKMFTPRQVTGLAVVGGEVSGGLVVLDFDRDDDGAAVDPFDLETEFVGLWLELIADTVDPALIPRQRTGGGGWQFFVRCPDVHKNSKLAKVPASNEQGFVSVIETRGEGGYALLPPSLHPYGGVYCWKENSPDLIDVPTVTPAQLEDMLECARALDRMGLNPTEEKKAADSYRSPPPPQDGAADVIAAWNAAHSVVELLETHGYGRRGQKYLAPDSRSGNAGVSILADGRLAYSHHGDALGDGQAHDAFDLFALFEHGSDKKAAYQAAARALGFDRAKGEGAGFTFGTAKNAKHFASNSKNTVPDSDDLMQIPFASKNTNFASNSKNTVPDSDDSMQNTLHQIEKWGKTPQPPPPEWLVHHLLQDNAENSLAGEPGVGKSWLVADLAVSVATGSSFLGRITRQGPVLLANFDDAEALPRLWAERSCQARGYTFADLPLYYWQPDPEAPYPSFGLLTPHVFDHLTAEAARIKPRLIVVDAFSTAFPGKDGNKGQDVVEVFEALRQLRVASGGACIVLVDHTPKQLLMESKRRGVSGSQQKHARTRSVHIVTKLEPSEIPGGGDVLEWRVHKINAAPYQEPFGITRVVDTLRGTARLEVRGLPEKERAPKTAQAASAALLAIQARKGQPIDRQTLLEEVQRVTNVQERTVTAAIAAEVEPHPNIITDRLPGRGAPKQYRWHGGAEEVI